MIRRWWARQKHRWWFRKKRRALLKEGRDIVGWDPAELEPSECPGCWLDKRDLCGYHRLHGWTPRNREERRRAERQSRRRGR